MNNTQIKMFFICILCLITVTISSHILNFNHKPQSVAIENFVKSFQNKLKSFINSLNDWSESTLQDHQFSNTGNLFQTNPELIPDRFLGIQINPLKIASSVTGLNSDIHNNPDQNLLNKPKNDYTIKNKSILSHTIITDTTAFNINIPIKTISNYIGTDFEFIVNNNLNQYIKNKTWLQIGDNIIISTKTFNNTVIVCKTHTKHIPKNYFFDIIYLKLILYALTAILFLFLIIIFYQALMNKENNNSSSKTQITTNSPDDQLQPKKINNNNLNNNINPHSCNSNLDDTIDCYDLPKTTKTNNITPSQNNNKINTNIQTIKNSEKNSQHKREIFWKNYYSKLFDKIQTSQEILTIVREALIKNEINDLAKMIHSAQKWILNPFANTLKSQELEQEPFSITTGIIDSCKMWENKIENLNELIKTQESPNIQAAGHKDLFVYGFSSLISSILKRFAQTGPQNKIKLNIKFIQNEQSNTIQIQAQNSSKTVNNNYVYNSINEMKQKKDSADDILITKKIYLNRNKNTFADIHSTIYSPQEFFHFNAHITDVIDFFNKIDMSLNVKEWDPRKINVFINFKHYIPNVSNATDDNKTSVHNNQQLN